MVTDSPGVVFGEHSTSKAAATFASDIAAHAAADQLRGALGLGLAQVQVITPNDRNAGRKLQPEDKGIERTLIRTHAVMGVAGLLLGLAVFGLLWALGVAMIVNSPYMALGSLLVFGLFGGLMFGGFLSLRPDQDAYIHTVYQAMGEGRSAVVVHAFSEEQKTQAAELLATHSGEVVTTL